MLEYTHGREELSPIVGGSHAEELIMCGFAGFHKRGSFPRRSLSTVKAMTDNLYHRGPDDGGEWISPHLHVALGFRRLSILDLTALGHQPMVSSSGRYMLVMNGEIYNHRILRAQLEQEGARFRGNAETEVLLESFFALDAGLLAWRKFPAFLAWELFGSLRGGTF